MKSKKYLAKGLLLSIIVSNLPIYSFASNIENRYYNKLSNIETKKDLKKIEQKDINEGDIDTWIDGFTAMPTPRGYLTSAVVNERIYCIGGYNDLSRLNTLEVYNPLIDKWETKKSMPTDRNSLTSSVVNGKIYVIGGYGETRLNTLEVYNPLTDTWETKTSMPTARESLTSAVVNGKIYVIGGYSGSYSNKVEVYDPITDTWETKANMPTARESLTSTVIDGKIYAIGGKNSNYLNKVEVYDPLTDTWKTKTNMPTSRNSLTSVAFDKKIYCIGGYNTTNKSLNKVEVYDTITDTWETKTSMPTAKDSFTSQVLYNQIYCIGGMNTSGYLNTVQIYKIKEFPLEDKAKALVSNAEISKDVIDIENTRKLVNQLPEGVLKDGLQNRLDAIIPNLSLESINNTSNVDLYIKSENMLSMSLDTNSIVFEDFSGIEDMEKVNAVNVTISSSLPYQLNAYLPVEIQNSNKTKTMDKSILNIKESGETEYKSFTDINTKVILKDNCIAGNTLSHGIDLKLKQGVPHEKDVYKATIKLEVEQK